MGHLSATVNQELISSSKLESIEQDNDCRNRARASSAPMSKTPDRVLRFTALFAAI